MDLKTFSRVLESATSTIPKELTGKLRSQIHGALKANTDAAMFRVLEWANSISRESGESISYSFSPFQEAQTQALAEKGEAEVDIITSGMNQTQNRNYLAETLEAAVHLYEGVPMMLDHRDPFSEPSVKDWAAVLESPKVVKEGKNVTLRGVAHIIDSQFHDKLKRLRESKRLDKMGLSHDAFTKNILRVEEDQEYFEVVEILKVNSVDFVTHPNAGGGVRSLEAISVKDLTLEIIRESRPDLYEQMTQSSPKPKGGRKTMDEETRLLIERKDAEILQLKESQTAAEAEKVALAEKAKSLETKIAESTTQIAQVQIKAALEASKLPQAAKDRLASRHTECSDYSTFESALKEEEEYIASLGVKAEEATTEESKESVNSNLFGPKSGTLPDADVKARFDSYIGRKN